MSRIEISDFHVHVYYGPDTRASAARIRGALTEHFKAEPGPWRDEPIGPHPHAQYQVKFAPRQFGDVVPWLMLHHEGLAVLIHPSTGDAVRDHTEHALWLGTRLELNVDLLRRLEAARAAGRIA